MRATGLQTVEQGVAAVVCVSLCSTPQMGQHCLLLLSVCRAAACSKTESPQALNGRN